MLVSNPRKRQRKTTETNESRDIKRYIERKRQRLEEAESDRERE